MVSGAVGVLGATGAVGRVAVARLAAAGVGPLLLGGRDLRRAAALAAGVPGARAVRVDLADPGALAAFCAPCALVCNCAGPSYRVLGSVARAALAAGAASVDAAGDRPAMADLAAGPPPERPVVLSAGVVPGLAALLPRLVTDPGDPPDLLEVFAGGAVPITPVSALDVLLTTGPAHGTPFAAWRDGEVVARALQPRRGVALPGFDGPVDAVPFLSAEAVDLAARIGARELHAFSVYAGQRLPLALAVAWAEGGPPEDHAADVIAAAAEDLAGRSPFSTVLVRASRRGRTRHVLLRTIDPYGLSGAVVALAARAVLDGAVPPGVAAAADVLDPRAVAAALAADPLVTTLETEEPAWAP